MAKPKQPRKRALAARGGPWLLLAFISLAALVSGGWPIQAAGSCRQCRPAHRCPLDRNLFPLACCALQYSQLRVAGVVGGAGALSGRRRSVLPGQAAGTKGQQAKQE